MFRKGIFFLILTGLLLCAGCAGRETSRTGELYVWRLSEKIGGLFAFYADVKNGNIIFGQFKNIKTGGFYLWRNRKRKPAGEY